MDITTPDPAFDPSRFVTINGYEYAPVGVDEHHDARVVGANRPPFISAPSFNERDEERADINGSLFLRADFAARMSGSFQQALAERDGEMFGGTLNDDLRFILGQPSFTFIRHAQIWRAAGHNLPHRAEDEQAFFIGRMLHHYLTVPSEWHDSWADEIEAVQNEARQALAAKGDSRG